MKCCGSSSWNTSPFWIVFEEGREAEPSEPEAPGLLRVLGVDPAWESCGMQHFHSTSPWLCCFPVPHGFPFLTHTKAPAWTGADLGFDLIKHNLLPPLKWVFSLEREIKLPFQDRFDQTPGGSPSPGTTRFAIGFALPANLLPRGG